MLNASPCLHVIIAAAWVPIGQGLVWANRMHHGRDNWGWWGVGVVKASNRDSDNCEKMYVLSTQEIKGDKEEQYRRGKGCGW